MSSILYFVSIDVLLDSIVYILLSSLLPAISWCERSLKGLDVSLLQRVSCCKLFFRLRNLINNDVQALRTTLNKVTFVMLKIFCC